MTPFLQPILTHYYDFSRIKQIQWNDKFFIQEKKNPTGISNGNKCKMNAVINAFWICVCLYFYECISVNKRVKWYRMFLKVRSKVRAGFTGHRWSKQSRRRWCETPLVSLWRHCNALRIRSPLWSVPELSPNGGLQCWCFLGNVPKKLAEQTVDRLGPLLPTD